MAKEKYMRDEYYVILDAQIKQTVADPIQCMTEQIELRDKYIKQLLDRLHMCRGILDDTDARFYYDDYENEIGIGYDEEFEEDEE